jgi:Parvulin-like peptidyl-prolyl isomerase
MKKIALLLYFSACFSIGFPQEKDPVVVRIGNEGILKSEFEYNWNKNKGIGGMEVQSRDEYLELFIRYKLKVAEAKVQGIDTTRAFRDELAGYRRQLAGRYFADSVVDRALMQEVYQRRRQYVEASHILLAVRKDASPQDTLAVYQKAMKLYERIRKGEDFAKLAKENSDDRSSEDGGYLGFSTGSRYILPFENALFSTSVGEVSMPVRTPYGYHLVKVHSRRPAGGLYRSGHIFKSVPPDARATDVAAARDSIFKIYQALKTGGSFEFYATKHSDDQSASKNRGEYGWQSCGTLPYDYEQALFRLKVGAFSEPFRTVYGWHIVKALEFKPYPPMEEMQKELEQLLNRDDWAEYRMKRFVEKLKEEYAFAANDKNTEVLAKAFEALRVSGDSTMFRSLQLSQDPIFTLNGLPFSQRQFVEKMKGIKLQNFRMAYSDFVEQSILAYEDGRLEKKYPEFGSRMQEYRDGILLFEVSSREVWDKASADTLGQKHFFLENRERYAWSTPHYKGCIVQCANKHIEKRVKKMLKKLPADSASLVLERTFNTDSTTLVKVESGLFALGDNVGIDGLVFGKVKLETKPGLPIVFTRGHVLPNGPECYTDVRGLVVSDYQNYLEKKWIESLRVKFKVIVDKDAVNTVN